MKCPTCQTLNPQGARFCFNCGNALSISCSNCGTSLSPGAKLCPNCGQPVTTQPASLTQSAAPDQSVTETDLLQRFIPRELLAKLETARRSQRLEGERLVVTILFCDVKGSTAAASNLDPEEWAEIINGAFEHMISPIYRYEGMVARLMGDGLLAFFGAPIAHEDDPQRAILAGLDILQAMRLFAVEVKGRWNLDFDVRVGVNTGMVVVGAVGSTCGKHRPATPSTWLHAWNKLPCREPSRLPSQPTRW
jgi:class 3 adenylate cyclase